MPKIDEMFAFIIEDSGPEDEGIIGMETACGWLPFVGADMKRVDDLRPMAKGISYALGKPVKLIHFTRREELEVIKG